MKKEHEKDSSGADAAVVATAEQGSEKSAIARHTAVAVHHLGCPGHLIVARYCVWRRHTQIGTAYRVSTVGDYYDREERKTIGSEPDSFFETMVFETLDRPEESSEGCGCLAVLSFSEIDGTRYKTAGEAQRGHDEFVRKYIEKAEGRS